MQSEAIEQFHFPSPMMAANAAPNQGIVAGAALAVTTGEQFVDLTTLPALPADWPGSAVNIAPNVLGRFMDIESEGADVYVVFGPTQASVTGANKPVPTATNTVSGSGGITARVGTCMWIPAGTSASFKLWLGPAGGPAGSSAGPGGASPCRFMAFTTKAGTATLRCWMSSEAR